MRRSLVERALATSDVPQPAHASPRAFGAADHFGLGGRAYRWLERRGAGHLFMREDGIEEWFSDDEIACRMRDPDYEFERGRHAPGLRLARAHAGVALLAQLDPEEADYVRWKALFITEFHASVRAGGKRTDAALKESIAATHTAIMAAGGKLRCTHKITVRPPPSVRTARRWIARYELSRGNVIVLRDAHWKCGNRAPKLAPEVRRILRKQSNLYAREERPSVANLLDDARKEIRALNVRRGEEGLGALPMPSVKALSKQVRLVPAYVRMAKREGSAKADRFFGIVGEGLDLEYPLQRVEIDCWEVSLQTFLEDSDVWRFLTEGEREEVAVGRMWLCVAIDCATECILGMRLARTANPAMVMATLEMAVSADKGRYADLEGTLSPWDMCGSFYGLVADSGSEFLTEVIEATADLRARHYKPPAGRPQHRPIIERFFGAMHTRLLPYFTGRTFEDVRALGDYPSQQRASLDCEGLANVMVRHVVDRYHNEPHGSLGQETPLQAWNRLGKLYPIVPPPGSHARRAIFGRRFGMRVVDGRGVRVLNLHYTSEALQARWRHVGDLEVMVKVDHLDLGYVSALVDGDWHALRCSTDGLDGVAATEWIVAWSRLRAANAAGAALAQRTVDKALAEIQRVARDSRKRVGIHLELLTDERLAAAEARIGAGFTLPVRDTHAEGPMVGLDLFSATRIATPGGRETAGDGHGRNEPGELPAPAGDDGTPGQPAKRSEAKSGGPGPRARPVVGNVVSFEDKED